MHEERPEQDKHTPGGTHARRRRLAKDRRPVLLRR